jgi:DNA polymerase-1
MDRRALRFVDRMQEVGLRVDVDRLVELELDLEEMREERARDVRRVVGDRWFNPGSSDQVAKWLYSGKGLPVLRYTESGRGSTSDESLQMLRGYHAGDPDVRAFLDAEQAYREADKCLGTFVRPIFHFMERDAVGDWRLHPRFRVTRVVSGRNSSHDPNVLAFPTRTKLGKRIRKCFVAREGFVLLSCDASQIELRVMAHHSRDPRMRRAFADGEDLHALTTTLIFKIALDEVAKWPEKRYVSKTINFAVMYGISAQALLEQLYKAGIFDFTLRDCESFIREWFAAYPSVRRYLEALWGRAEVDGFVRDMWGRICYVPNLRVLDGSLRESAQRLAGNMPIQGGAHGLVKRAEIRTLDWIEENGLREEVLPWLQIHDELLLEVREGRVKEIAGVVEEIMTADQAMVSVPIVANSKAGKSWGELEELEEC